MTTEIKKYLSNLKTIANYGKSKNVTPARIYQLIASQDILPEIIDGIKFIDTTKYPSIPSKR
jgi:hypothetical protein